MRNIIGIDIGSLMVIIVTFVLFVAAIFFKGMTHDLLLEAGVFLVSLKLIIMGYKIKVSNDSIQSKLDEIKSLLREIKRE